MTNLVREAIVPEKPLWMRIEEALKESALFVVVPVPIGLQDLQYGRPPVGNGCIETRQVCCAPRSGDGSQSSFRAACKKLVVDICGPTVELKEYHDGETLGHLFEFEEEIGSLFVGTFRFVFKPGQVPLDIWPYPDQTEITVGNTEQLMRRRTRVGLYPNQHYAEQAAKGKKSFPDDIPF